MIKKTIISFLVVTLLLVIPAHADMHKVKHVENGSWSASFVVKSSKNTIKSVKDIHYHATLGKIISYNVSHPNKATVVLKLTRQIGLVTYRVGLKAHVDNNKLSVSPV
ncbi:MAG: DUF5626 family protein [Lentilactobacillus diolivorans]|uniref:DUF5626 family protein n=1 Tax=Lentilactobacillus diolivorans TaxID=179838 RepID=UPI0039ED9A43